MKNKMKITAGITGLAAFITALMFGTGPLLDIVRKEQERIAKEEKLGELRKYIIEPPVETYTDPKEYLQALGRGEPANLIIFGSYQMEEIYNLEYVKNPTNPENTK